ncbi:MAG: hypothetical protein IJR54_09050 [Oscillibacter sp.]|nr:hypothetical protein [Oscillibacter sp.]
MRHWNAASLLTEIHDLLYRLGVKATIQGFFETSCAVFLVMRQRDRPWFSIMEIYREISALYHIDLEVIDPRIRRVIRKIWKSNPELLNRIAGEELRTMPTPRHFINILCRYLTLKQARGKNR